MNRKEWLEKRIDLLNGKAKHGGISGVQKKRLNGYEAELDSLCRGWLGRFIDFLRRVKR